MVVIPMNLGNESAKYYSNRKIIFIFCFENIPRVFFQMKFPRTISSQLRKLREIGSNTHRFIPFWNCWVLGWGACSISGI